MVNALRATSPEILEAYMTESTEGSAPISVAVEAVEKAAKQGTISPMAGAELIRQMWSAGKSDAARADYLRSMINSSTGELTPQALNAARRIDQKHRGGLSVGGQAEIAPTAEAAGGTETAGGTGNDLADGGRIGIPGQRAGEQNGGMAEGRKALTQAETAVRRQADAKNLRTETVDARAHIREAAEGSTLRLAPEEMVERDPELRAVKRRLEEITGKQVHYILGTIQRAKGGRARGAITGSDIWLQCDNLSASVTQLGAHELYHYYRDIYPGLNDRMRQRIIDTWSAEEFQRVAEIYLDKLGAVCGLTEDMDGEAIDRALAKVEEELFADAYGNLNAFKAGADKFTETARAVVKETVGKETAAATERTTGPPTQFSGEDREDYRQKRITGGMSDQEREDILRRKKTFTAAEYQGEAENTIKNQEEDLNSGRQALIEAALVKAAKEIGLPGELYNADMDIVAAISTGSIKESAHKKIKEPEQLIKLLPVLKDAVNNAVGIEAHDNRYFADNQTLFFANLLGGYVDGEYFVPVRFGIKAGRDGHNTLYVIISGQKINKAEVMETPLPGKPGSDASRSALEISIENLARKVKHPDILKYLPDGMLTQEQKEIKWNAIADTIAYTNEKNDRKYKSYLKSGKIKAADAMVKAAAKEAGYTIHAYHGTGSEFNRFDKSQIGSTYGADEEGFFFSSKKEVAEWVASDAAYQSGGEERIIDAYLRMENPLELSTREDPANYYDNHQSGILQMLHDMEHDGIIIRGKDADMYVVMDSNQIKSADPVTYDDEGNVIPLSERFNPEQEDIRFSADEDIPDNAAEYNRLKIREENRIPESAAEYDQMKRRAIIEQDRLRKLEREGDEAAKERREELKAQWELKDPPKVTKSQATIARKDLRNALFDAFSVPAGQKAELGAIIDAFAEKRIREGTLSETDRKELFDRLYEAGVVTVPADDAFQAARALVKGGRIYVPENIKHEFGDGWNDFRKEAFAEGILLVNDDQARGVDQWNADLADELPGLFDADNYDPRDMLERIVQLAREGRDQQLSLAEYAAQAIGREFISEDELMDNLERQLDWALRTFADKAGLETYFRKREGKKLAEQKEYYHQMMDRQRAQEVVRKNREREKRKEAAQKQAMNRELKDLQQRTLKQLRWLSQNRNKFGGDMQAEVDKLLENIDIIAASAADEMHLDKKTGRTWKDLRDMYVSAQKNDPNWLPSTELKNIVIRLDYDKIADLDIGALQDLYKAAVGMRTELYNRNNVIADELHSTFSEVYDAAKAEITSAPGGYETGAKGARNTFFNDLQLTPMNRLERMAGWNPESRWYGMARMLEQGERDQRRFKTESARQIAPVLEKYKDWMKTADGQGKDGKWYEIEVPANWEYRMGDKPVFSTETVKVYMTPAQKVHMYLESKSYDNLRHMEGGRTFADKELYSKGKRAEAFAQGKTVRLLPETVKQIVSDLTPEEQALADALEKYYNGYSKQEINRVSNILYGYDKAMEGNYAPIYTNDNYTKSEPGIFDTTAEGVGNLKSRVVSSNPSLNISAFDAFEKSVDKTGRFVGLAIPIRNMNTLMNWREQGNSMKDILDHKWGEKETKWVEDLMTELQSGKDANRSSLEQLTNQALSRYISAVFGANPSIVLKQFASYPLAAAYLGWENMPLNIPKAAKVDTDLMSKYTGELDYRLLGYATPETATIKDNPGKLQKKGGAITWMDGFTVRTLWTWAENKVMREQPGIELGTQEQINAGQSPYYKAVAKEFEEAVSRSQPMYDIMHRSNVMREKGGITRAFTLFKTVPQQEYNMLRQTVGEAAYYKRTNADKETQTEARKKAGRAFAGVIAGNLMIGLITFLNAIWKNKGKKYRDEDGNLTAGSLIEQAAKQYIKDSAGLIIGGGEAADILSSVLFGDKWYGIEMPGIEQSDEIIEGLISAGSTLKGLVSDSISVLKDGGDLGQYMADHAETYLKAVDNVVSTLGTYGTGLPIDNVKAYLLGTIQWISPAAKTAYEDALKKADRTGLKGLTGASLTMRTKHILQDRAGQVDMRTVEELARLYEAGYTDAIPTAQQTKLSINGEERALNLAQQQTYKNVWKDTVSGALDELVGSGAYQAADEPTRAKMLKRLYDLATDTAKAVLFDDYEEPALTKAQTMQDIGISLADYAAAAAQYSAIGNRKDIDSYERGRLQRALIDGMNYGDREKLQLYLTLSGAESRAEKFQAIMDAGLSFRETVRIYDKYAEIDGEDASSGEKAQAFALWVDKQEYTNEQRQTIKDQLKTWQIIPVEASRYEKYTGLGFDPDTASAIDKAIAALEPLPGHDGITNAQKWNAGLKALGSNASKKDKLALVGSIMGTAMVTDAGNPTQWAKFNRVVDSGVSIENALGMIEDDTFDTYIKWMDSDAKKAGVNSSTYLKWRETSDSTHSERDADGKEIKGKTRKDKLLAYIDSLSISSSQKDALFLEEYKESGLKDTPWHGGGGSGGGSGSGSYAPARLRVQRQPWELGREDTLRLREEQPEQPRSGLKIRGGERANNASRSGLRIRG
ncbi:MAG: hypothetical protein J6T26_04845 [Firmicutes bacterium]|nr:hypothetical protein [Bacillota bacterium]